MSAARSDESLSFSRAEGEDAYELPSSSSAEDDNARASPSSSSADDDDASDSEDGIHVGQIRQFEPADSPSWDADRPGRFKRPANAWLKYTHEERGLSASLEQQEANDLSVHLYTAHTLKAKLRDHNAATDLRPWSSKLRWNKSNRDETRSWQPEPQWTAWPLHPDEVPRKDDVFGTALPDPSDEIYTIKKPELYTPSTDLQADLEALILKHGRARFLAREWTEADDPDVMSIDAQSFNDTYTVKSHDDSDVDMSDDSARTIKPEFNYAKPTFMMDDDAASEILQQPVRHVIAKFDELLLALHKSKTGHHRRGVCARSRSRSKSVVRSGVTSVVSSKVGLIATGEDDGLEVPDLTNRGRTSPVAATSSNRDRLRSPATVGHGLRDWSEVLGVASLVGWDVDIVDRATRRCASLFDETMAFRDMHETASGNARDELFQYIPNMISRDEFSSHSDSEASSFDTPTKLNNTKERFCPYKECSRHDIAFDRGFRWREHLKKKHKLSSAEVGDIEKSLYPGQHGDGTTTKVPRLAEYPCPVDTCKYRKNPLLARHRWRDHLRRSHKYSEEVLNDAERVLMRRHRALSREPSTSHAESSTAARNADFGGSLEMPWNEANAMVGGVHNDGFMKPVTVKIYQRGRGQKRKTPMSDVD